MFGLTDDEVRFLCNSREWGFPNAGVNSRRFFVHAV